MVTAKTPVDQKLFEIECYKLIQKVSPSFSLQFSVQCCLLLDGLVKETTCNVMVSVSVRAMAI